MPSPDMLVQQSSKLPTVLGHVPSRQGIKITHHPSKGMALEHWRVTSGEREWLAFGVFASLSVLIFVLACVSSLGGFVQFLCVTLLALFLLPAAYFSLLAAYENRAHLVCYHDGFASSPDRLLFKPPVQEDHLWRDVRRIEVSYEDGATRQRIQELRSEVKARRALLGPESLHATARGDVGSDSELVALQRELRALLADSSEDDPVLDLDALREAEHDGDDVSYYNMEVVLVEERTERIIMLTKAQSITLYEVIGGMAGLVYDDALLDEDTQDGTVPEASDDW